MKVKAAICSVALVMTGFLTNAGASQTFDSKTMEHNKEVVLSFYNAALNEKDAEKASSYLGEKYVQHNPMGADGADGLRSFVSFLKSNFPGAKVEVKQAFVDGNTVILHTHAVMVPGTRGSAVIDIFRLEKGRIVEHWDVVQDVPEKAANNNGMF